MKVNYLNVQNMNNINITVSVERLTPHHLYVEQFVQNIFSYLIEYFCLHFNLAETFDSDAFWEFAE